MTKIIQIYASRIETDKSRRLDAIRLVGIIASCGIQPGLYDCLCKQKPPFPRLEKLAWLDTCDKEEWCPENHHCWGQIRQIIQGHPDTTFYIENYANPYRKKTIGEFPNVIYINDSTPAEVFIKLFDRGK
jgi:hypothetical protein